MDCRVCPWRTLPCPVMGGPPEFLQPLAQGRNACLSVRIVRSQHYYGEAPHTLGLLRARRERPRCRAAEQRDELATPHLYNHRMNENFFTELSTWLTRAGLAGTPETDI